MNIDVSVISIFLTALIVLFTGLTFLYQRKESKIIKPTITEIDFDGVSSKIILIRLVNPAPYKITLVYVKLKKYFLLFPRTISELIPETFGDYHDVGTSSRSIVFKRISKRSFVKDEQVLRCPLDIELIKKVKYSVLIKTSAGKAKMNFYYPIKEKDIQFTIDKR